jgi:hypothetical protein
LAIFTLPAKCATWTIEQAPEPLRPSSNRCEGRRNRSGGDRPRSENEGELAKAKRSYQQARERKDAAVNALMAFERDHSDLGERSIALDQAPVSH